MCVPETAMSLSAHFSLYIKDSKAMDSWCLCEYAWMSVCIINLLSKCHCIWDWNVNPSCFFFLQNILLCSALVWDGFFYIYAVKQKMHVKQITKIKKQSKKQCNESDISRFSSNDCLAPKLKTNKLLQVWSSQVVWNCTSGECASECSAIHPKAVKG